MLGRRMVGIDLNALAHFVASVRTRPLSDADAAALRTWAGADADCARVCAPYDKHVLNLPAAIRRFFAREIAAAQELRFPQQEAFARCALLRLGQWALDCRGEKAPGASLLRHKLPELVDEMLDGLVEFTDGCWAAGISNREISSYRQLLFGNSAEVAYLGLVSLPQSAPGFYVATLSAGPRSVSPVAGAGPQGDACAILDCEGSRRSFRELLHRRQSNADRRAVLLLDDSRRVYGDPTTTGRRCCRRSVDRVC